MKKFKAMVHIHKAYCLPLWYITYSSNCFADHI